MGCDIHSFAEVRRKNKWEKVTEHFELSDWAKSYYKKDKGDSPFDYRDYSLFAFLADVRNYDYCEPITPPKGFPSDASEEVIEEYNDWEGDAHTPSYLTLEELLNFDYDKKFWNRRVIKQTSPASWNGAALAEEGEGEITSYRDNLGEYYFKVLDELKELGNPKEVRVVFWFDN